MVSPSGCIVAMFRISFVARAKVSAVVIRPGGSTSLTYEKRYRLLKRMTLSKAFDSVNEENRYTSLKILLDRLSGNVGRRQYKMKANLEDKCLAKLKTMRLDWHDIKQLPRDELIALLGAEGLNLTHAERAVFLSATTPKVCGVLRKGVDLRHTENICMNAGLPEHGWRCGKLGHVKDVYFEGKSMLNPLALEVHRRPRSLAKREDRNGVSVEVRPMPDFSVSGRLTHEINPRIWSTPSNAVFDVHIIGYEFRVHPEDPRTQPQIREAEAEWQAHAEVVRHVLWEMLELYGVERPQQPMNLQPYELGEPDQVNAYSAAFARKRNKKKVAAVSSAPSPSSSVSNDEPILDDDVIVEPVMTTSSSSLPHDGNGTSSEKAEERSWFTPPLPQAFTSNGIPEFLPFAPTFMVQCTFKPMEFALADVAAAMRAEAQGGGSSKREVDEEDAVTKYLLHPVVEISCLTHPNACYWMSAEDEAKVMGHVISFAKRVPFALPFNLYLRVDPSKLLRGESGAAFRHQREARQDSKNEWFSLKNFGEVQTAHDTKRDGSSDQKGADEEDVPTSPEAEAAEFDANSSTRTTEEVNASAADEAGADDYFFYGKPTSASPQQHPPPAGVTTGRDDDQFSAAARAANPPGWI